MPSDLHPVLRSIVALLAHGRPGRSTGTDSLLWHLLVVQGPVASSFARVTASHFRQRPTFSLRRPSGKREKRFGRLAWGKPVRRT